MPAKNNNGPSNPSPTFLDRVGKFLKNIPQVIVNFFSRIGAFFRKLIQGTPDNNEVTASQPLSADQAVLPGARRGASQVPVSAAPATDPTLSSKAATEDTITVLRAQLQKRLAPKIVEWKAVFVQQSVGERMSESYISILSQAHNTLLITEPDRFETNNALKKLKDQYHLVENLLGSQNKLRRDILQNVYELDKLHFEYLQQIANSPVGQLTIHEENLVIPPPQTFEPIIRAPIDSVQNEPSLAFNTELKTKQTQWDLRLSALEIPDELKGVYLKQLTSAYSAIEAGKENQLDIPSLGQMQKAMMSIEAILEAGNNKDALLKGINDLNAQYGSYMEYTAQAGTLPKP